MKSQRFDRDWQKTTMQTSELPKIHVSGRVADLEHESKKGKEVAAAAVKQETPLDANLGVKRSDHVVPEGKNIKPGDGRADHRKMMDQQEGDEGGLIIVGDEHFQI